MLSHISTYMNVSFFICEDTCAQKFDVYLSYDIYVTIYVNIRAQKSIYLSCVIYVII